MIAGGVIGGSAGSIKSIQVGTIAIAGVASNTAALTAVDVNNTLVFYLGAKESTGTSADGFCDLVLTSSILLTATRIGTGGTLTVSYAVVEFYPGFIKSLQTLAVAVGNGSASGTQAVTAVDITKSFINRTGIRVTDAASGNSSNWDMTMVLTSNVLVTATRVGTTGANTASGQLVETY